MSASNDTNGGGTKPRRRLFPWAVYLFGMVTTAPIFTYFALRLLNPARDGNLPQGAVDPLLTFLILPAIGAAAGLVLVALLNLAYGLTRGA